MSNNINTVDAAIRAVCPIDGVSFGKPDDKQTWRIDFKDIATPEQRVAAQSVVDGFDLVAANAADAQIAVRKSTDAAEAQASRVDAAVTSLLDMTAAQRVAWARTNFPSLTQPEQNKLGMLLTMVAIALRPLVR